MIINDYMLINKVDSGASSVEKYKIHKDGKYYLLRLFDARFMNSRYAALSNIETLYINGINVPKVYEKGILNATKGYALLDWIDGISLDEILVNYELETQYGGLVAKELAKMHNIKTNDKAMVYDSYIKSFKKKMNKIVDLKIDDCPLDLFDNYVSEYSELLKKISGNSIIHGDFHPGNVIINDSKIVFIDLDVCKVSNPWEDLSSNACNMDFPNFYSSIMLNYFDGNIPKNFWQVYYLYGILYILDYILYALRTNGKTLEDGLEKMKKFLDFTDNFHCEIPKWFNSNVNKKVLKKKNII